MEKILLVYGSPWETVTAIMKLYENMKATTHSLDSKDDFFDISTVVF